MKIIKLLTVMLLINIFTCIGYSLPRESNILVTPSEVQFQVIDPLGNVTGYNPVSKTVLKNIPNTSYYFEVEPTGAMEATKYQKSYLVGPKIISDSMSMLSGLYKIRIFGSLIPEQFRIGIHTYYQNLKGPQMLAELNSLIYPNVTWTYEFTIPDVPTATGEIILTKVAQPSDLITDLTTAGQLGYIGNPKFISELTKKINEIEKERLEPQKPDDKSDKEKKKDDKPNLTPAQKAKKDYTELLGEITEKYNKPESDEFVKQEAYTVLREDIEYIIGHL